MTRHETSISISKLPQMYDFDINIVYEKDALAIVWEVLQRDF